MSGLDALAPREKAITVAGRQLALRPIRMGKLSAFAEAAMPVAPLILAGRIAEAATEHYANISAALIIATGADQAWLDELFPDDYLRLVQAVVEVNSDFFLRRLAPLILVAQATIQAQVDQITQPSLPISGETDTPSRLS